MMDDITDTRRRRRIVARTHAPNSIRVLLQKSFLFFSLPLTHLPKKEITIDHHRLIERLIKKCVCVSVRGETRKKKKWRSEASSSRVHRSPNYTTALATTAATTITQRVRIVERAVTQIHATTTNLQLAKFPSAQKAALKC